MKIERTKNAKRNILFGVFNKFIALIGPFLVRTVLIQKLGVEYVGLNSLFASILQVLNLSELGFGSALVYNMYKPVAENDIDKMCALLNFYKKVYRLIGLVILIVGIVIVPFIPHLINGTYPQSVNIYILFLIYLFNTVLTYWLFAYKNAILNACQRVDVISNILSICHIIMYILQIAFIYLTKNYYLFLIAMPLCTLLNNIITYVYVNKKYPQYVCKGNIDATIKKEIKIKVGGLAINKVCQMSRNSFDSIFISAYLGLTVTAIYSNYYYIIAGITSFLSVITSSMFAGVGNSIVKESVEKNYNDFTKFNFLYMWISGWCSVCLLCLYDPFMKLWLGEELTFPISIVVLLVVYFYALKIGDIRGVYLESAGLWWENKNRAIIETMTNIVLNYLFVRWWGISGIIIATIISLLIINFGFGTHIVFKYYFKNRRMGEFFMSHIKYAICTSVIATITYFLCKNIEIVGFFGIILKLGVCCIVPNTLYVLLYKNSYEYKNAIEWIRKIFNFKKIVRK